MAMHVGVGLVVIITKIHRWDESAMFFDGGSLGERCPIQYLHPPPFTLYSVARPRALTWTYVAWAWILFTRSTPYLSDGKLSLRCLAAFAGPHLPRSEEHTSELQSHSDLVCRLLLEKKKKTIVIIRLA